MRILSRLLFSLGLAVAATSAHAATSTIMIGDDDCFGETDTSPCTTGLFPVVPTFDNRTAPDGPFTDFMDTHGALMFDFLVDLTGLTLVSAEVSMRTVGIDSHLLSTVGDANEGAVFDMNGTQIGTFFEPVVISTTESRRTVADLTFTVPLAAIVPVGTNTLTITPEDDFGLIGFEDYAIDYVKLTLETSSIVTPPPVPLPASAWLLGGAMAGLMAFRRKTT